MIQVRRRRKGRWNGRGAEVDCGSFEVGEGLLVVSSLYRDYGVDNCGRLIMSSCLWN